MRTTNRPTSCRGLRGAVTVEGAGPQAVRVAVERLLGRMVEANGCRLEDVTSVIFTVTADLAGSNPAAAARASGWGNVPLLTVCEHPGDTGVDRCIRVLVLWNSTLTQAEVRHVYLGGARALRPDLVPVAASEADVTGDGEAPWVREVGR